jgi:hypothetical protein
MGKILHASESGYFPKCIEESADSKFAVWPLEQAMQTYWRVREWEFNADIVARVFDFPEEGQDTDLPFTASVTSIRSYAEDESTLVCNANGFERNDSGKYADILFSPVAFGDQFYKKVGDLYYSGLGGLIDDGSIETEFSFSAGDQTFSPTSQFTISILGSTLAITANYYGEEPYETEVISCTASLVPSEWWSYGGTYNTSTGEPL